ncbi:MFS transporter [Pseudonocardia broussonetiae]|nr:MFS transporter [Pseudonocardia broussonetiae]
MTTDQRGTSPSHSLKQTRRAAAASLGGTMLEYYDFAIYGLAAALVFGPVFFPSADPTLGVLASFATFGVGFLARPLGGIVFGHLGDRLGRKNVLVTTMLMMGVSTVLIGCLPGHDSIGYWGAVLLVVLRLVQGFAFGGEQPGAILLVSEHAAEGRRGLFASLPGAGVSSGLVLGNLAFLAVNNVMDPVAVQTWGWRIPFWAGGVLVVVGLLIRFGLAETPDFEKSRANDQVSRSPVREVIRTHPSQILLAGGVQAGQAVASYITVVYSLAYAREHGVPAALPLLGIILSGVLHLALVPAAGALSDRFGRLPTYLAGAVFIAVTALFFFPMVGSGSAVLVISAYLLLFGIGWAVITGVYPAMLAEAFATKVSYSGLSLGMQLGVVVGGLTPFAATLVATLPNGSTLLGIGLSVVVLLSGWCAAALVRRTPRAGVAASTGQPVAVGADDAER